MHNISTESILERLVVLPIDKSFYTRQLRSLQHGPISAPVPSTLIPGGQIAGMKMTAGQNTNTLSTWKNTLEQTGLATKRSGGMNTKDSKFYMCHTS